MSASVAALLAAAVLTSPVTDARACSGLPHDFDGDGRADLAVAAPYEEVSGRTRAGAVTVLYGSGRTDKLTQDSPGVTGEAETGDSFGSALAVGDFDGDRADELAIGAPTHGRGGAVFLYGTRGAKKLTQDTRWIGQAGRITDQWGAALTGGDFDGDGRAELVVGAPADSVVLDGQGSVTVIDVRARRASLLTQDSPGLKGEAEKWDSFGAALTSGDFNADGRADLAVGSPGEGLTANQRALDYGDGMVHVLYGTRRGLSSRRAEAWSQNALDGKPRYFDRFGSSLVAADFNGDGDDELAVGVPGESAVQVLAGTRSGGLTRRGNLLIKGSGRDFGASLSALRAGSRHRALSAASPVYALVVAAPGRGVVTIVPGARRPGAFPGLRPGQARRLSSGAGLYGFAFS
ncbi:FG-GAP repeat protein [Nonomuraea soli]|uniref:VCBS repeat-containing protein n=1 Tax=Nonomuraea soli TaxID=1032476 RepID=A0A7W0CGB8_9ACTN|nr:FG-GAP repeat protein [Nonomuraea soli]MBA2890489.1 hypothetical protein [Nonomuraea soli]